MDDTATIRIGNENYTLPILEGTEGERAIDTRKLRAQTGYVTYDEGYGNTGSCQSKITFIDGEKGILRYRGYPIEEIAENSNFVEAAYLTVYGELPKAEELRNYSRRILRGASIHEGMKNLFNGFPTNAHPMVILSALLNTLGSYYPELATNDRAKDLENFDDAAATLLSKVRTVAAMSYRMKQGLPFIAPKPKLSYCANFLHMMFSEPYNDYVLHDDVVNALDLIFLLHADHEQNCSTSTVRMVASGGANLFASVSAGVCALWGPLHGGANMAVVKMLQDIHDAGDDGSDFIEKAKTGETRLMGFGHRVYKNYDPRAKILGEAAEKVLAAMNINDPLLDIARRLETKAREDDYFVSRNLYPNVDFYSGIILQAIGIPLDMFTVIFAIGRMPGWIANWKELAESGARIHRPRQIYQGATQRSYVKMDDRK
ncbi:citrate synthase [Cerasicoccus frondis]|uniref:citrate synthase n=1 Tax=Cerasicoccus frondis TaxID=490090 RepID=UPI00285263FB|nr:citrate synthase [Cerasicoccus frondis]